MTARTTSTVLVGRQAELGALTDALKRVRADEPAALLVGGEAGVGKTRLVEEFGRLAARDGARLLTGQCLELGEEGLPFAPFAAALREVLRRDGPAAFAGHEPEFARLLPELGPAGPQIAADSNRGYFFDLVAGLVGRLAADGPLVLVIEDLHWADRSTRDLIAFLVRSARTARMLLLCTYRTDELHRGHPLRPFLAELDRVRGVERVELARLDRDGTGEILADLLGSEPRPGTVESIHKRAQGNPFFIEELAACGDPNGCCEIPDTLRDLLLSRVDRLPEPAQRVLRIAAAGGSRFGHDLLLTVAGMPEPELEEALRAAVAAQLLVAIPEEGYEFRHALVREAVHDDLLPGEHVRLHARYAAAIEADPQLVVAGRAPAEIAHHWHAAHDHPRALTAALHAAAAAEARYAYAEQSRLLERALELWEQVPDAADRIGMDHLALVEETLRAAVAAGDYTRALSLTRAALGEVDSAAEPLRAARLLQRRGKLKRNFGKSDGVAELRQAYELARDAENGPERVRLLSHIAESLGPVAADEAARIAREAVAAAAGSDDATLHLSARITSTNVCSPASAADEALVEVTRVADTARELGDVTNLIRAQVSVSHLLFELGRYAESARTAAEAMPDARRVGIDRTSGAYLIANHAEALVALGRWDEAETLCAEAARLDPPGTLAVPWLEIRARLRLARGHAGAVGAVARVLGYLGKPYLSPQQRIPLYELRITAALAADDHAEAVAAATTALDDPVLPREPRYTWPLLVAAARAAVSADASAPDAVLAARIREIVDAVPARHPAERAAAAEVTATLAPPPEALAAWRAAVEARRTDGQPYQLAGALLAAATAAAAAGDRGAVASAVAEAATIAGQLGARPLAEQAATLARRVGLRDGGRPGAASDGLTSRELEVLRLVAEGHSNSRIAEELYISPKTASVHVSRIIAKLAVSNRVEAAAVAHRLGLLTPS
ncbi:helix-turn-helix transcriptional regulator [Micromonospora pattaloongensis]|uniref:helix-turn-helix transcriptional regulator n=1 Tax=Micromonospora pattaloongensis TaxID=405436 RepID=UPI001FE0D0E5|nr:helix-turn-helix transcriptional regulator [Micromonospora pattaloongensis]